mgnify:CR=1 FL=1
MQAGKTRSETLFCKYGKPPSKNLRQGQEGAAIPGGSRSFLWQHYLKAKGLCLRAVLPLFGGCRAFLGCSAQIQSPSALDAPGSKLGLKA